ncbi:MAG: hypothetical protein JST20_13720, partial [Bacteroidetes bacterium]|nr:hypothetical protein [Bacteroidota bacterium]
MQDESPFYFYPMKTYILLFLFIFAQTLFAQKEANNWYFGKNAAMTFQNGTPQSNGSGKLDSEEGCASISDKITGELLFYTDGVTVWNRNHQIMKNGTGLKGSTNSTQSAVIVPNPGNNLQYYIFTTPSANTDVYGFYFSLVSLENPDGEIISKNNLLMNGVAEKLTGTEDCSKSGYWVVTHHATQSIFYSFHVTATGVNLTPVVSTYSSQVKYYQQGCIKISPNKLKITLASTVDLSDPSSPTPISCLELFDFNASTGEVTNFMLLSDIEKMYYGFYGVSFSPDNTKLYATGAIFYNAPGVSPALFQYDLNLPDAVSIRNSVVFKIVRNYISFLQLGPDGKIYIASNKSSVNRINKPNLKDTIYNYKEAEVVIFGCMYGLPNFMDYNFGHSTDTGKICTLGGGVRIGSAPLAGCSYSWSPTIGLDNSSLSNPLASPTQTTEYTLKVTNTNGCESIQTYIVTIADKPKIAAVAPICIGSSVELSATGGDTYLWSPSSSVDTATKSKPIATPKVSTRYKVIVTRGDCTDSAFLDVEVINPKATAGSDKTICTGGSVQIGDSVSKPNESYTWTPNDGLNNPTLPNPIASPTKTTQYILEVYRSGCTAYDTVLVTVIPKTKAIVSGDTVICGGGKVQLLASGGSAYSWIPPIGLDNPSSANPTASPITTTRYKVIVSSGNCVDSAFVTVKVTPFLGAKAGIDKTVCEGATAQLGDKPEPGNIYSWQPITNLDNPTIANPICSPSSGTTEYILTVTNSAGCVAYDTVLVTVGNIVAKVSGDTAICAGSSVQLLASGGSEYEWSPSVGLDDAKISNPIATPTLTTTYTVVVSSGTCRDSAMVTVTVNPKPTANAGEDKTICTGASVEIGEKATAGNTYSWQPTNGLNDRSLSNPIASPSATTEYILTVTGVGGCVNFDTLLVTVGNISAIVSGDTAICEGSSVQLLASGGNEYLWSPSVGLNNPNIANPIVNPTKTTTYKVVVSSGLCIDSAFVTVSIIPPPIVNAGQDTIICVGQSVQIGTSELAGNSYHWKPSIGLNNTTISNPTASPNQTTEYILTVTNSSGCVNYDTVKITVNP